MSSFFHELKRRNVYRVAVAYMVVAWLLIQAASILFPTFEAPGWMMKVVVVVIAIGFLIALIIAWAFEMTPQGMKRTEDLSPDEQIPQWSARKFAALIISLAIAASGLLLFQLWRPQSSSAVLRTETRTNEAPDEMQAIPAKSIAVLPFVNMSSDKENEYFVDGLTEEILNRLAQISALRVPGRTSSFAFKGKNADLRQIGGALSVANVLEGSVRKSGNQLRITAQLVRTADGFNLWSNSYDRKLDDVFAVQEEIARAIANALSTPLGLDEIPRPERQTKDMVAYDNFLQARALLADRTVDGLHHALGLLTSAVDRDPRFADGWAALAQARALSFYYVTDVPDPLKGAEDAARNALAIDDSSAMAHSALADVLRDRHEWLGAETEYQRALKLSPGEAETHNQYAQMLAKVGRLDGSLVHALRACELEPLGWVPPSVVALVYLSRGEYSEARTFLDRSEKISGRTRGFHARLELFCALSQNDRDLARHAISLARAPEAWSSNPPSPQFLDLMDRVLESSNTSSESQLDLGKALRELRAAGRQDTGLPLSPLAIFVGQRETALDALFVEAETWGNDIVAMIWTPVYQPVRTEPRFREFLRGLKMPEYWRAAGWGEFCRAKGENDFECVTP